MSIAQAHALLTAPGAKFEMETIGLQGVATRVWKNAPPTLRDLVSASRAHGDRLFVVFEDERVTYDAYHRAVAALAADLVARGVGKGDRVALAMRNLPEWPVAFFAAVSIGAIVVPLNAWWTGAELDYGLRDSGATALIADAERHDRLAPFYAGLPDLQHVLVTRAAADVTGATWLESVIGTPGDWPALPDAPLPAAALAPEDDATIFYTSGTTGAP